MKTTLFVYNFSLRSHRIPWVFHVQRNPGEFQVFQVCGHPELQKSKIIGFPTKFPPKTKNKPSSGYQHHKILVQGRPTVTFLAAEHRAECESNLFAVELDKVLLDNGLSAVLRIKRQKPKPWNPRRTITMHTFNNWACQFYEASTKKNMWTA